MSRVAGSFRRVETRFGAKSLAGALLSHLERRNCWTLAEAAGLAALDEHQVRTWTSWHRWVTLAMLAYAFLAVTRASEATIKPADEYLLPLTCNEIRHLFVTTRAPNLKWDHRTRWSTWRRHHQATAQRLHYQRQLTLAT